MVGFISSNKRIINFYSVNVLHLYLVNGKERSHKKLLNKMSLLYSIGVQLISNKGFVISYLENNPPKFNIKEESFNGEEQIPCSK